MSCDVLVTVEPHWFILRVACVAVWLRLVPITPSHLMMSDDIWVGVCTLSSSASYYLTLLCLRTPGLVLVMLASAEEQRRSYRTQETPGHTQTHSVLCSLPSMQQRSALVCCVLGTLLKMSYFPGKYGQISHFASKAALHYIIYFVLLREYWLI